MNRGFKTWAENEALTVRGSLGLAARERLPGRVLLKHLGAIITRPARIPGMTAADIAQLTETDPTGWSAITAAYNGTSIVIINDAHNEQRQESDMHHEASHLLRKHKPCELVRAGELTIRVFDPETEEEASWLAGCLHLPRAALVAALRSGDGEEAIAARYMASTQMVRYRRSVTGVDRQLKISSSTIM